MSIKSVLLGNGFDLHHNLPTKYIHIIRIFEYWSINHKAKYKSVGELYGSYLDSFTQETELDRPNKEMQKFYQTHKSKLYDVCIEDDEILNSFSNCFWFNYFTDVITKDIGWIDFENEINIVIKLFQSIIDNKIEEGEIITLPDFASFKVSHSSDEMESIGIHYMDGYKDYLYVRIDKTFLDNHPLSPKWSYRSDDIAEFLYKELSKVKKVINYYIIHFINSVLDSSMKSKNIPCINDADIIINLNYSKTVELVYGGNQDIIHYHGEANDDNIVLGISSSLDDELNEKGQVNTSFIMLKKYYQRIIEGNDIGYLNIISFLKEQSEKELKDKYLTNDLCELAIIGHSLDKSDADVIKELFQVSDAVKVYYNSDADFGRYIQNLTRIFGKIKLCEMRKTYKLRFEKLPEYICD